MSQKFYLKNVSYILTIFTFASHSLPQVVKVVAALGVFFGYPIQFFVMMKIIWPPVKRGYGCAQKYPITIQVVFRFIMVMLTCKFALISE